VFEATMTEVVEEEGNNPGGFTKGGFGGTASVCGDHDHNVQGKGA
jgi:hypothetical protein